MQALRRNTIYSYIGSGLLFRACIMSQLVFGQATSRLQKAQQMCGVLQEMNCGESENINKHIAAVLSTKWHKRGFLWYYPLSIYQPV